MISFPPLPLHSFSFIFSLQELQLIFLWREVPIGWLPRYFKLHLVWFQRLLFLAYVPALATFSVFGRNILLLWFISSRQTGKVEHVQLKSKYFYLKPEKNNFTEDEKMKKVQFFRHSYYRLILTPKLSSIRFCRLRWEKIPILTLLMLLTFGAWDVQLLRCWMESLLGVSSPR